MTPAPLLARTLTRAVACLLLLGALLGCSRSKPGGAEPRFPKAPVVLVSVDTLRSDRLPMYGYAKGATPALDLLRKDSVLFEKAYAHVPLTLPSHVSLFTGLEPGKHGVLDNSGYRLDPAEPTLAELLKKSGYATGGAVSAIVLGSRSGVSRGFDLWDERIAPKGPASMLDFSQRPGGETAAILLGWVRQQASGPFFAFLHTYEPHAPYEAPEPYRSRFADPYDAEVAYSDAIVGEFLAALRREGVYDRAIVIFLSDHGEGLGDHGEQQHGIFLYRESIQVPLLVKLPGSALAGGVVSSPVQLTDVFATVADLLGLPGFPDLPGTVSLARLAAGGAAPDRRIFAENFNPRIRLGWSELRALVSDRHEYIQAPAPEFYDLLADPAEKRNLAAEKSPELRAMVTEIERRRTALRAPAPASSEEAAKLRSLGYLTGSAAEAAGPLPDPKDAIGSLVKLQQAVELHQKGRSAEAEAMVREVLAANPRLVDAWEVLSAVLERQGRMDEAVAALKKTVQLSPAGRSNYLVDVANLALRAGNPAEARAHADAALSLGDPRAAEVLARVSLREKDLSGARRWAEEALKKDADRGPALLDLARVAMLEGKLDEARARLEEARGAGAGGSAGFHLLAAEISGRRDDLGGAEREYRLVLEVEPANVDALSGLAIVSAVRGDLGEAGRRVDAMLKAAPTPEAYVAAVLSLRSFGNPARAQSVLSEGRRRFPADPRLAKLGTPG